MLLVAPAFTLYLSIIDYSLKEIGLSFEKAALLHHYLKRSTFHLYTSDNVWQLYCY